MADTATGNKPKVEGKKPYRRPVINKAQAKKEYLLSTPGVEKFTSDVRHAKYAA